MPPPNNKAKHLLDARVNALINKNKHNARKQTEERKRYAWAAMPDVMKENSDILMKKKGQVQTLEDTKTFLLVLYRELEIALT